MVWFEFIIFGSSDIVVNIQCTSVLYEMKSMVVGNVIKMRSNSASDFFVLKNCEEMSAIIDAGMIENRLLPLRSKKCPSLYDVYMKNEAMRSKLMSCFLKR